MEVKELKVDLKEGHAVAFDFDGVIHSIQRDGRMEVFMMSLTIEF